MIACFKLTAIGLLWYNLIGRALVLAFALAPSLVWPRRTRRRRKAQDETPSLWGQGRTVRPRLPSKHRPTLSAASLWYRVARVGHASDPGARDRA